MSYQVLARKWRPRNFSTLVGQEHVVRALTHALSEQRLHHAYLFTGTRGVGKTTIARILAKSLNCETGITVTPCGQCSSCQEIDSGRFVDLLEVDAATNTRVDEMRQLLENAIYAPTRGRYKVYVIDEVHMLSNSAFNAMLKTLEEPPEHVKFILATTDPQKIPVTVLSRCLQFNLKQMSVAAITEHLAHILSVEGVPFEASALTLIGRSAAGSMRDALSLLDQAIAHGAGRIEESMVREMLGAVDLDYLYGILESLASEEANALVAQAANLAMRSISFSAALQELSAILTRLQIVQLAPGTFDEDDPDKERVLSLARSLSPEFVQLAYQIANLGRQELAMAPDEYSGFVMTLLRMHAFRPASVSEAVRAAPRERQPIAAARKVLPAAPVVPKQAPQVPLAVVNPPGPAASAPAETNVLPWSQIVAALNLSGLPRELAQNCELRTVDRNICVLRLPPAMAHLQMKPSQEKLQAALAEYFGHPLQLRIELAALESESPALANGRYRQEQAERATEAIQQDPFVREAISILDASVIQTSIKSIS
ncbi:MAG: DNA polymerase III subunit gamma/tau [Rhodocyclales bacterium]|nr:DNA polymerase III subunit gamma/tau [Rhodocyclales bacterium]